MELINNAIDFSLLLKLKTCFIDDLNKTSMEINEMKFMVSRDMIELDRVLWDEL